MYAVGRLGSYISRGVYTVSAPFHPFGGAVDIVVVEQQDGSFKSSPWYVRFGKFQGVLKAKERAVDINVNGEDADFSMYLDHTGEAYFLREVDIEEGDLLLSRISSGEEMDELERRPMKSNSWNEAVNSSDSVTQLEVSNGKVLARSGSRRSRLMGLVFGRNSVKDSKSEEDKDVADVIRAEALESAEYAADLLEVKWSTNLGSFKKDKDNISRLSAPDILNGVASKDFLIDEDSCLLDRGVTKLENRTFRRQPTVYYETLETSKIDSDDYGEQDNETVDLSCVKSSGASVQEEISSDPESSTDVTSKVEVVHVPGVLVDGTSCKFIGDRKIHESEGAASQNDRVLTETTSEPVTVEQTDDSPKKVDSSSTLAIYSSSDPISSVQDEKGVEKEFEMKRPLAKPFYDSKEVSSEFVRSEEMNNSSSVGLDEEQFLFSDLDNFKVRQDRCVELIPIDHLDKQNYSSLTSEGIESVSGSSHSEFESPVKFMQENLSVDDEESRKETNAISSQLEIPRINKFAGQELGTMVESLPNMCSQFDELDGLFTHHPLGHSLDSSPKSSEWASLRKNYKRSIKPDAGSTHNLSHLQCITSDTLNLEELKTSPSAGNFSKAVENSSSGRWGIWPFKRSSSMKDTRSAVNCPRSIDAEISLESTSGMYGEKEVRMGEVPHKEVPDVVSNKEVPDNDASEKEVYDTKVPDKELPKPKAYKKLIRVRSPTTEQLASLNLKDGGNIVTFTFATAMLGKQQVDARIYLWRWDTRIVITDVDGTITKSDVLGQFMPLVGKDWSQTGVAHLFSAIKENGYQLLFLSARAISQAGITRQFLFNLKQDGKGLPEGPVVISPDGLFPSLFREVIRRAPHEFKIACLEEIKACFPSDRNPFYAGFGNRDTDEFSYLKVGIPKGKIFIINPKGEVVVNRCDNKSYTSLHALVNGMFPPTLSSEQEDFNSWNFWKLPPPLID